MTTISDERAVELLPCPFCGSAFLISQEPHDNHPVAGLFYIYHDYGPLGSAARRCHIEVRGHFDSREQAVSFWNSPTLRQQSPALPDGGEAGGLRFPHSGMTIDQAVALLEPSPVPGGEVEAEGFVLVPAEPTEAMMGAGIEARVKSGHSVSAIYRAMIAARPIPDTKGAEAE